MVYLLPCICVQFIPLPWISVGLTAQEPPPPPPQPPPQILSESWTSRCHGPSMSEMFQFYFPSLTLYITLHPKCQAAAWLLCLFPVRLSPLLEIAEEEDFPDLYGLFLLQTQASFLTASCHLPALLCTDHSVHGVIIRVLFSSTDWDSVVVPVPSRYGCKVNTDHACLLNE